MKYDKQTQNLVHDIFKYSIGLIIVIGLFVVLRDLIHRGDKDNIYTIVGAIAGAAITIFNYEFGSSNSSQKKDEFMEWMRSREQTQKEIKNLNDEENN